MTDVTAVNRSLMTNVCPATVKQHHRNGLNWNREASGAQADIYQCKAPTAVPFSNSGRARLPKGRGWGHRARFQENVIFQ